MIKIKIIDKREMNMQFSSSSKRRRTRGRYPRIKALRGDEQEIDNKVVFREGNIYVLKDEVLRIEVIWLHHDIPVAGHGEKWKTTELVTKNY